MWKRRPPLEIITLSLWRSPIPMRYVATQYPARLRMKRSVAAAYCASLGLFSRKKSVMGSLANAPMRREFAPPYLD